MNTRDWGNYVKQAKADIDAKLAEAESVLTAIKSKLDEAETNRKQGTDVLASINESFQNVTKLISETSTDLNQVAALRVAAFDETTGIDAQLKKIATVLEQAEAVAAQVTSLGQTSSTDADEIKKSLSASKSGQSAIEGMEKNAKQLLLQLQQTYELAISTGLAGSFDKRQQEIKKEFVTKWGQRFEGVLVVIALFAAGILIYTAHSNKGPGIASLIYFRLSLISPLAVYAAYAAVQYAKERTLLEKYAFKAVVASSIQSYTELLRTQFPYPEEHKAKILPFVLRSMEGIYSEPHEEVKKRTMRLNLKGSKVAELRAELKEDMEEIIDKKLEKPAA